MSDVFQEVEEEYRREQMAKFWAKYRVAIVAGVAALIVGVAGYQGWSYWRARQIEASSRGLESAAQMMAQGSGQEKEAADALAKIVATGSGGYPLMARFQEAALRAELGDVKSAVAIYDSIAAKGLGDAVMRDYAQLRAAILLSEIAPFDEIKRRLEPLAKGDGAWHLQAMEMLAYAAWRAGKKDDALKLYADIQATPGAPAGTKRRALEMAALVGAGMKLADIKTPPAMPTAPGGSEPLLLPPTPSPTPGDPSSLLGPSPTPSPTPEDPSSLLGPNPAPPSSPTP